MRSCQSSCCRGILGSKDEGSCRIKGGIIGSRCGRSREGSLPKDRSLREFPLLLLPIFDDVTDVSSARRQFLLHTVEQALPSLLEFGVIAPPASPSSFSRSSKPSSIDTLRLEIDEVSQQLLPELVGLTDAFGFSDWELDSVVSFPSLLVSIRS